ncbi:hypothetical protein T03_13245 [Trichinella britovi]|uniref:Uncharacterized protein n=1 Tax=Trichinella britovi TaxID=45882 RepID=A0A0V1CQ59_TRIBR|nr:hypothetical protein T03_13245 [Trichinella britovi]
MTHRVNIPRHTLRRWTVIKMLASETPFAAFCKQAASFDLFFQQIKCRIEFENARNLCSK